jgi:pimeloyl-ACP methyl ester carboxylesterase
MPYVESGGARIYWTTRGQGPPVLFIMGLAFSHEMWFRVVEWVAPRFQAVLFDNRGSGRSDAPRTPYSIAQMAADAVAVLDAAGVGSAHVLGASMGGMIAQELVLRWPERVRSLTLGCTHAGWLWSRLPRPSVFANVWKARGLSPEQALEAIDRHMYHPDTPQHLVREDRAVRLAGLPPRHGYRNQILAVASWWGSYWRLPRIAKPVVILHGADDPLIPVENGRMLQRRIPGARLEVVADCRHVMPTDQPRRTAELVTGFLDEQARCA